MVDADSRVRNVEERLSNLQRQVEVIEQNRLSSTKQSRTDIRAANDEISELKAAVSQLREDVNGILEELKNLARKDDVDVVKKYLDIWEPMHFVQQSEVEGIVRQIVEEKLQATNYKPPAIKEKKKEKV